MDTSVPMPNVKYGCAPIGVFILPPRYDFYRDDLHVDRK